MLGVLQSLESRDARKASTSGSGGGRRVGSSCAGTTPDGLPHNSASCPPRGASGARRAIRCGWSITASSPDRMRNGPSRTAELHHRTHSRRRRSGSRPGPRRRAGRGRRDARRPAPDRHDWRRAGRTHRTAGTGPGRARRATPLAPTRRPAPQCSGCRRATAAVGRRGPADHRRVSAAGLPSAGALGSARGESELHRRNHRRNADAARRTRPSRHPDHRASLQHRRRPRGISP
ncbi:transposase [Rhodococcus wratislaviensis IFP 2016]|nr:transposase [Rhodococcus wratislaviensis IFP 2016]